MYVEVLAAMAARLGWALDDIRTDHHLGAAAVDLNVAAGTIAAGSVSSTAWRWHGLVGRQRALTMSILWTMEEVPLDGPLWTVDIKGSPGVRIAIHLDKLEGSEFRTSAEQLGLAGAVVNAIPYVCAAAPGVIASPMATPARAGGPA